MSRVGRMAVQLEHSSMFGDFLLLFCASLLAERLASTPHTG
jgi:hypothetical protein